MTPETVCRRFGIEGEYLGAERVSGGNINATWFVAFQQAGQRRDYVAQRLNPSVFHEPERVMHNIALVTEHLRRVLLERGENPERQVLRFLTGADGRNFLWDEGALWRCYPKIQNSVPGNRAAGSLAQLEETGAAFGRFQRQLLHLDASRLYETIPGFHDTPARFDALFRRAEKDPLGRAQKVRPLLAALAERRELAGALCRERAVGRLPLRVTHNDTKCGNVLFDRNTGKALAVIDLDTVMPGLMAYDFGDAVRSAAGVNRAGQAALSPERFSALTRGFLRELADVMTPEERDSLAPGALCVTLELSARYLEDYLSGDRYFAVQAPEENLRRAERQLGLAMDMERKLEKMQKTVEQAAAN